MGDKGPSRAALWFMLPMMLAGAIRVAMHIVERFDRSIAAGVSALVQLTAIIGGICVFFFLLGCILEQIVRVQAKRASGTKNLMPMNLTVLSYQQAFELKGEVVFLPKKHQGVLLVIRADCLELFTGFAPYPDPLMRIRFSEIQGMSQKTVQLYGGKEPGVSFECGGGSFELGFVRTVVFRPISISKASAQRHFDEIRTAWESYEAAVAAD